MNLNSHMKQITIFGLCCTALWFFTAFTPSAFAAAYTWDGGGSTNNWSDCDNWSTNTCPVAGDAVTFDTTNTKNSTVDTGWTASSGQITSITIASGYTGTISLQRSLSVGSTFSMADGTFTANAQTADFNGAFTISGGIFNASTGTTSFAANFTHTAGGTYNHNNGTVVVDGTSVTSVWNVNTSETLFNLTFTKGSGPDMSITAGDTIVVNGDLTLSSGSAGSIVQGGALQVLGDVSVTVCAAHTTPITFSGSDSQTISSVAQDCLDGDITVNKTIGTTLTALSSLTMNASGQDLTLTNGTFDLNSFTLIVNGASGTLVVDSGGTFRLEGGETITLNPSNPTLSAGSTVAYDGTSGPYTLKDYNYQSIEITGGSSTIFTLAVTENLAQNLTITSGVLALGGNGLTVTGTFTNNGTLQLQGGETVTLTPDSDSGIVRYRGDGDGSLDNYTLKNWPYYSLTLDFADAADTAAAASSPLDVNGTFTISGGVFTAPASFTIAENFLHTGGTFTHNGGTVTLDGSNQTISGTTTFNHFTKSVASAATLTLPAGATQTFVGTLTLNGANGQVLSLRSSSAGTQASIDPQGTRSLSYVNVRDNNNINTSVLYCVTGCVQSLNVTNWSFVPPGVTVSLISGNTAEAGTTATFTVVLDSQPTADVSMSLSSSDTTEGTVSPASLTFTSGNWSTPQTVTVTGVDDSLDDGNLGYSAVVGSTSSAEAAYNGINPSDVSVINVDNDTSGFTLTETSGTTDISEAGLTDTYTIVLTAEPTASVTISLTGNTDLSLSGSSVIFSTGAWSTPQTITVSPINDLVIEGPETVTVSHTISSDDAQYSALSLSSISVSIADNDELVGGFKRSRTRIGPQEKAIQILQQKEAEAIQAVAERVTALPPTVQVHKLIKLPDDEDPVTQSDTTVYYIGADGYRHAFPNSYVFESWFTGNAETLSITEVSTEDLAQIPLGKNVIYRPGNQMVKFYTSPRVYAVETDGSLRWIKTETVAEALYGEEWNENIHDIDDVFFGNYHFGENIEDDTWDPEEVLSQTDIPSDAMQIPGYVKTR